MDEREAAEDADLNATLGIIGTGSGVADPDRTTSNARAATTDRGERFRVLRPHAQGGLGAVFVALDGELHREVALKQILEGHADDPVSRQRFILEAEITGGLEHPGIVPVYGLGATGGGRPYYAMRFIRGDSLKEAIARFHKDAALKKDPGRRSLELQKLLRRFLDVCNAIDYAHSRGVLHRDLKPSNVIVGRHGETLVVDWGLAKAVGRVDIHAPSDERPLTPSSQSGTAETLQGSAVGTPAYMSPEQARGDLDAVATGSDVYSLGATLYCLLVGEPPFAGTVGEVLRKVEGGDFETPRKLDPSIEPALEAVCLKAMATRPEDRYPTCRALADDIERFMADEPVSAWREPFVARARRWARRHRTPVAAAAAALLVGMVVLVERNRQVEQARQRAEDGFRQAREAVDTYFTKVSESRLLNVPGLQPLRKELLDSALAYYRGFVQERGDDPDLALQTARAQYKVGKIVEQIGSDSEALQDLVRARDSLQALSDKAPDDLQLMGDLASAENGIGTVQDRRFEFGPAEGSFGRAAALRERLTTGPKASAADRASLALTLSNLGNTKARNGRQSEGLTDIHRAITLLEGTIRDEPDDLEHRRDLAHCHTVLVRIQTSQGEMHSALASATRAREIYEGLHQERPDLVDYASRLALALDLETYQLRVSGRPEEALAASERSQALMRPLVEANPQVIDYREQLAISYNMAGDLARQLGRIDAVGVFAGKARDLMETLQRADPKSARPAEALAKAFNNLGRYHAAKGRRAEALAAHRRSIELKLAKPSDDPEGEYNLACYLALALSVAAEASPAEREGFATRAIAGLRRAVSGGLTAIDLYRTDSDLDSLRGRSDFRQLMKELATIDRGDTR
jgi:serine/threonine-protein kinase